MPEPRCEIGGLPVSMCAHCRPQATAPVVPPRQVRGSFPAMYPGRCVDGCGELIHIGDMIVTSTPCVEGGFGNYQPARYMHAECFDADQA